MPIPLSIIACVTFSLDDIIILSEGIRPFINRQPERKMADQKKKLNKKALAGFLLAILSPVLAALLVAAFGPLYRLYPYPEVYIGILIVSAVLFPVLGRIFSVIGLIVSIVKRQKGKGFAIAGIVISELEFIVYFGALFFELLIALCGDVRKPI